MYNTNNIIANSLEYVREQYVNSCGEINPCDISGTYDLAAVIEPKLKLTYDEAMKHAIACGGNWTRMLLTVIQNAWPEIWDTMPNRSFEFNEINWMLNCLCTDTVPTWCGEPVDMCLGIEDLGVIRYCGGDDAKSFEFLPDAELNENLPYSKAIEDWYRVNCGVSPDKVKAYTLAQRNKDKERKVLQIMLDLCREFSDVDWLRSFSEPQEYMEWEIDKAARLFNEQLLEDGIYADRIHMTESDAEIKEICDEWLSMKYLDDASETEKLDCALRLTIEQRAQAEELYDKFIEGK